MSIGKTYEFAEATLQYYVSGSSDAPMPTHTGIWVGLLSGNPDDSDDEPFYAQYLSAVEVSAGNYRAQVSPTSMTTFTKDTATSAARVVNSASVDFSVTAPVSFNLSGYAICISQTSTDTSGYIGYEIFEGATASKQRTVQAGDTVRVNVSNFILRER